MAKAGGAQAERRDRNAFDILALKIVRADAEADVGAGDWLSQGSARQGERTGRQERGYRLHRYSLPTRYIPLCAEARLRVASGTGHCRAGMQSATHAVPAMGETHSFHTIAKRPGVHRFATVTAKWKRFFVAMARVRWLPGGGPRRRTRLSRPWPGGGGRAIRCSFPAPTRPGRPASRPRRRCGCTARPRAWAASGGP